MTSAGHEQRRKTIFGPEPWKVVASVTFHFWDRWLLRLAVDDVHGLDGLILLFQADRKRRRAGSCNRDDAEAKLAHIADLKSRLAAIDMAPREVLGEVDATDKKLLAKARTKLFEQCLSYKSPAMVDIPRRRLEARALRGHWAGFPVSPTRFEHELRGPLARERHFDWRGTMWLSQDLGADFDRLKASATSEADRLAL